VGMRYTGLHERLNTVAGDESYRRIGSKTEHNPETVRRYMKGQSPSVEFIASFCAAYDVNESWLLTGRGAAKASDVRRHQLSQANPGELLAAVAEALERLSERVDRIERFVQTMETRLRARGAIGAPPGRGEEDEAEGREHTDGQSGPADQVVTRAEAVADAIAKRAS